MKKVIIKMVIILSFSFNLLSQQDTVAIYETITKALECVLVNHHEVKKLIITDEISGNDYSSPESEWRHFRTLDEVFINLEEVEIWTSQSIPDADTVSYSALFYAEFYDDEGKYLGNTGANWLKKFSAPNVKNIGSFAFRDCKELISVSFASAETIGTHSFGYCWNLESIYFPSVLTIGDFSFYVCSTLTSISFPSAVETGWASFAYCNGLTHIKDEDFPSLKIMGHLMFRECQYLISARFPKVEHIGGQAFYVCNNLTEIYSPEARTIDAMAFASCVNLLSIDLPKITEILGYGAFSNCRSLVSVSMGTGFEEETEIKFGLHVFTAGTTTDIDKDTLTRNINLILGNNTLPKPNLNKNIWQNNGLIYEYPEYSEYHRDYIWKSITIYDDIEEKIDDIPIYYLGNNMYKIENVETIELYDIMSRLIKKYDNEYLIDLNYLNLTKGFYFFRIKTLTNKNYITKKIIVN